MTKEIEEIIKNIERYKQMEKIKVISQHLCKDHEKAFACATVSSAEREQKEALAEIRKNLEALEKKSE